MLDEGFVNEDKNHANESSVGLTARTTTIFLDDPQLHGSRLCSDCDGRVRTSLRLSRSAVSELSSVAFQRLVRVVDAQWIWRWKTLATTTYARSS